MTRALVLGGGGAIGIAWESGVVAGLADEGVLLADADVIIGTSAGAVVGSQLAMGRSPHSLVEAQLAGRAAGSPPALPPALPKDPAVMQRLVELMEEAARGERPQREVMVEIGTLAIAADTMDEDTWIGSFGFISSLGPEDWPDQHFICTAVDASSGEFVTWDNDSGVPLGHAVASSGTVPGYFPPVTIGGRRYFDGSVRSGTNADLARGYDRVAVVPVTTAASLPAPMAELSRAQLETEVQLLRESGSEVVVIAPGETSAAVFGTNIMDVSKRPACAEMGMREGREMAAHLRSFWARP